MRIRNVFVLVVFFLITGCGSSSEYIIKPDWDRSKLATVNMYRTNVAYHKLNLEKPYFYIDGKQFAKLGTGGAASIKVLPGKHIITVKEPFMFMPSYENARIEIEAEEGEAYYIRYSKDASIIIIAGSSANIVDKSTVHIVDKEYYNNRK